VADAADRRLDPGLCKSLGVLDKYVLVPAVAVVNQGITVNQPAVMKCYLGASRTKLACVVLLARHPTIRRT
jgi:hypothetical protein